MGNKPYLSGFRLKVKVIKKSGYVFLCWFSGRRAIKPEGAGHGDEFAFHFRVGCSRPRRLMEIDELLIVERDTHGELAPQ